MSYTIQISLFQSSAEPTVVNKMELTETNQLKYLTLLTEILGAFKEEQDITAPVLDISCNDKGMIDNILNKCNYAYIFELKKCYFITKKITGLNNIITLYLNEDVLTTWKEEIYKLKPLVTRQATDYDITLVDSSIPIKTDSKVTITLAGSINWCSYTETEEVLENKLEINAGGTNNPLFTYNGYIFFQAFTNVQSTTKDNACNGLVDSNRVYAMKRDDFYSVYKDIAKPSFWTSLNEWFTDYSDNLFGMWYVPFSIESDDLFKFKHQTDMAFMAATKTDITETTPLYLLSPNNFIIAGCEIEFSYSLSFIHFLSKYSIICPYINEISLDPQIIYKFGNNGTFKANLYLIINPNGLKGQYILLKNKLKGSREKTTSEDRKIYTVIEQLDPSEIIYESDFFKVGSEVFMGKTDKNAKNQALFNTGLSVALGAITGGVAGGAIGALGSSLSSGTKGYTQKASTAQTKQARKTYGEMAQQSYKKDVVSAGVSFVSNIIEDVLPLTVTNGNIINTASEFMEWYNLFSVYIKKIEPQPVIPDNYYELYGGVCNLTVELSTLKGKGFTKCANIHMTGFTSATLEEINEIESLLLSGVIL